MEPRNGGDEAEAEAAARHGNRTVFITFGIGFFFLQATIPRHYAKYSLVTTCRISRGRKCYRWRRDGAPKPRPSLGLRPLRFKLANSPMCKRS